MGSRGWVSLQAFSDTAKSQAAAKKLAKGEREQTRHMSAYTMVNITLPSKHLSSPWTPSNDPRSTKYALHAAQLQKRTGAGQL